MTVATEGLSLSDTLDSDRLLVEGIHAEHGQQLWGFARREGLSDTEAEEVVQEALLRLWRTMRSGGSVAEPLAWTFRVVYRLSMDRHRLRRRWDRLILRSARSVERSRPPADRDELLAVWSAVDQLPDRQRQVLYLRYQADLAFDAIAAILGIDASSARSNASRALATLRKALTEDE